MYNTLTKIDIQKMKEEIEYRKLEMRPRLIEDVKVARAFGDLSENFEYKAAKQEKNRNDGRIRYLERMIRTANIIEVDSSDGDTVGFFDRVEVYDEDNDEVLSLRLVTTLRQDAQKGFISNESPMGKALLGHKVGDRVLVEIDSTNQYYVVIKSLEKGGDDDSLPIQGY